MIPILYDKRETEFLTNGIGFLTDTVSCLVTEERNGAYELTLVYPQNGHLSEYIEEDSIIKVKANDTDTLQLFRIYKTGKQIGSNTTYYAEHISYELTANPVECFSVSGVNAQQALTELLRQAVFTHKYTGYSDITTVNKTSINEVISVRKALGGISGSLLDVWGGEYHFDNYKVELLKHRGRNNGVTIAYGKNLIEAKQEKNIADVVTAIFPYAYYKPDGTDEDVYVSLKEKLLIHPDSDVYAYTRCEPIDFSGEFEDGVIITTDMLREKAQKYIDNMSVAPDINITLSYAQLKKTKDYKNIEVMENISLCDTINVQIDKLGINATAKVVKTTYNSLKERFESAEVGSVRTNLVKQLNAKQKETQDNIQNSNNRSEAIKEKLEKTIKDVTAAITGNSGGYVVLYPEKNPQEILILDTPDINTAKNVWRWNLAGLGHSSNGVNGTFTTAITADGQIVADFITAGKLTGEILAAGTVYAEALDVKYRESVKKYTDDAKEYAIKTSSTEIKNTAEELKLMAKGIQEDNMHNYVDNPCFSGNFGDNDWYTNTSNNAIVDTSLGRCAKIVRGTDPSYIYINVGKLETGTYRISLKAATIKGQEPLTNVRTSFRSSSYTNSRGELKSDEWTVIDRDIEITEASSNILYIYAGSMNSTLLVTDVKVLGLFRTYAETQIKLRDEAIELEAQRAQTAEEALRSSIKVNANNIQSCVTKGNVSSYITQYYNNVLIAFNNSSKYVQIKAGEIDIYNGTVDSSGLMSRFDQNGNNFWRDGYFVGKIGTNRWKDDNSHKGLVFDLEMQGKYMCWSRKKKTDDDYSAVLCYSRSDSIYTEEGLHFGTDLYAHNYKMQNVNLVNTQTNGYRTVTKKIPIITSIKKNDDGTITWTYSSFNVRNGLVTAAPPNSEDI
jgi:phage minor structural protein|nr:MAG TPA: tail protein [Bacteriophage sp.]